MKMQSSSSTALVLLATLLCASARPIRDVIRFGPSDCVHVTKSSKGSCVISTHCVGLDTSHVEFAFNCVQKHGITRRHTYGTGGFEHTEEFDSEEKCVKCAMALPIGAVAGQQRSLKQPPATAGHALPAEMPVPPNAIINTRLQKHREAPANSKAVMGHHHTHEETYRLEIPTAPNDRKKHHMGHHHTHEETYRLERPTAPNDRKHHIRLRAKQYRAMSDKASGVEKGCCVWPDGCMAARERGEVGLKVCDEGTEGLSTSDDAPQHPQAEAEQRGQASGVVWRGQGESGVVKYGPKNCVSTWRNAKGDCVVQTMCAGVDTSEYDFGLLCDKAGVTVRHLFGERSFGPQEKFNTLIPCDKCLSHDKVHPSELAPHQENATIKPTSQLSAVAELSKDVEDLTKMMTNISQSVQKLNAAVLPNQSKPLAPAPAPAPATPAKVNFLHQHKQHSHHKELAYIQGKREEDDNEDEDEEEAVGGNDGDDADKKGSGVDADNEFDAEQEDSEREEEAEEVKHQRASNKKYEDDNEDDGNEGDSDTDSEDQEDSDKEPSQLQVAASSGSSQNVEDEKTQQAPTQTSKQGDADDNHEDTDAENSDGEDVVSMGPSRSTPEPKTTSAPEEEDSEDDQDTDGFA